MTRNSKSTDSLSETNSSISEPSDNNPIGALTIGSTVHESGNQRFRAESVFNPDYQLSAMKPRHELSTQMTGHSGYVYSDKLHEGGVNISGSYGVSGIAKVSGFLSLYAGYSDAEYKKTIDMNYHASLLSGIETIRYNDLTVAHVLNALSSGPQYSALKVLEAFLEARDTPTDEALIKWQKALDEFHEDYGYGIVDGIAWGGLGTVTTHIESTQTEKQLKYGGEGNFTYSPPGASTTIGAYYNGQSKSSDGQTKVTCSSDAWGQGISSLVTKWREGVEGKALDVVAGIDLLKNAPSPSGAPKPPSIPKIRKPDNNAKENAEIKEKLKEIKTLGDTRELELKRLYQKEKKECEDTGSTFAYKWDQFKEEMQKKNKDDKFNALIDESRNNKTDVLKKKTDKKKTYHIYNTTNSKKYDEEEETVHAVLGLSIVKWSNLFPWMINAEVNNIEDLTEASEYIRKYTMIQDLRKLIEIYRALDAVTCEERKLDLNLIGIGSARDIANELNKCLIYLSEHISNGEVIDDTYNKMSSGVKKIYETWNKNPILRRGELGFALYTPGCASDVVVSYTYDTNKTWEGMSSYNYKENIPFNGENFSVFSDCIKVFPFISPEGGIYFFGPKGGVLTFTNAENDAAWFYSTYIFSTSSQRLTKNMFSKGIEAYVLMEFRAPFASEVDPELMDPVLLTDFLVFSCRDIIPIYAYPLPYSAAMGVDNWQGPGSRPGIASTSIVSRLKDIRDELAMLNFCTLSSENWDKDWDLSKPYRPSKLKKTYIGFFGGKEPDIFQ